MFRKISILCALAVVFLCSCADKTTPEYTVKEFINAVKDKNEQVIVNLLDLDRILVQVKGEAYQDMTPEEARVQKDRVKESMLKALGTGSLSVINEIDPVMVSSEVAEDEFGTKALVVVRDRREGGRQYAFLLSRVDGSWKIFSIIRKPA